jgi:preprotein translocase subunit SecY
MFEWEKLSRYIPTVSEPIQKLTFREKAKWTFLIIVLFFILGSITVWGIDATAVAQLSHLHV